MGKYPPPTEVLPMENLIIFLYTGISMTKYNLGIERDETILVFQVYLCLKLLKVYTLVGR